MPYIGSINKYCPQDKGHKNNWYLSCPQHYSIGKITCCGKKKK